MTDYNKEKRELVKKCKEFLECHGNCENAGENKVKLNYFGSETECVIDSIYIENGQVVVISFADDYPDGASYDNLADFDNEEMKKIMRVFGIEV